MGLRRAFPDDWRPSSLTIYRQFLEGYQVFFIVKEIIKISAPSGDKEKILTAEHAETAEVFLQSKKTRIIL
jgi:hypothetical protein